MHLGMTLAAKALEVDWVVCAAFLNLDDVMYLKFD